MSRSLPHVPADNHIPCLSCIPVPSHVPPLSQQWLHFHRQYTVSRTSTAREGVFLVFSQRKEILLFCTILLPFISLFFYSQFRAIRTLPQSFYLFSVFFLQNWKKGIQQETINFKAHSTVGFDKIFQPPTVLIFNCLTGVGRKYITVPRRRRWSTGIRNLRQIGMCAEEEGRLIKSSLEFIDDPQALGATPVKSCTQGAC